MSREPPISRTDLARLELERDVVTDLIHEIADQAQKAIYAFEDTLTFTTNRQAAEILNASEFMRGFFLEGLEENRIQHEWVKFKHDDDAGLKVIIDLAHLVDLSREED